MDQQHEYYMEIAYDLAKQAYQEDEVPIGAVIVYHDEVIGKGYNQRNGKKSTLAHAEIQAINEASQYIGDWRLEECTMYITLEPCPMCAGAIVQARIPQVVMACRNPKAGCAGSIVNLLQEPKFNHQVEVMEGVLEEPCSQLLKQFFKAMRQQQKHKKNK
ncbi:tRNA adenosine(34) deaminase TadA [Vallitalea okinawensis]|uniref:tRNA adenosine(34) deaminase TadA n=1 Tax=Vallitalea okinawensis TaxID=2078660 RepID=UPI000CFE064D|nr:tRNA adenosine(34) deaminase TadA [Vallitalea okinawensis]